jgi:hypothetical protein
MSCLLGSQSTVLADGTAFNPVVKTNFKIDGNVYKYALAVDGSFVQVERNNEGWYQIDDAGGVAGLFPYYRTAIDNYNNDYQYLSKNGVMMSVIGAVLGIGGVVTAGLLPATVVTLLQLTGCATILTTGADYINKLNDLSASAPKEIKTRFDALHHVVSYHKVAD